MVVANDGTIFAVYFNTLKAISPLGGLIWMRTFEEDLSPPTISSTGKELYVLEVTREVESYLLSIDTASGKIIWRTLHSPGSVNSWASHVNVASDGTIFVAAAQDAAAYSQSGALKWRYTIFEESRWKSCNTGPSFSPDEDVVYAFSRCTGLLYAINALDGRLRWYNDTGFKSDHIVPVLYRSLAVTETSISQTNSQLLLLLTSQMAKSGTRQGSHQWKTRILFFLQ